MMIFQTLRNQMRKQKGFTLVELMVVIAILGVLAALVVPKFTSSTDSAKDAKLKADLRTIDGAIVQYYAANTKYPTTDYVNELKPYIQNWPNDAQSTPAAITYTAPTAAANNTPAKSYIVTGKDSKGVAHVSPGSEGYVAW